MLTLNTELWSNSVKAKIGLEAPMSVELTGGQAFSMHNSWKHTRFVYSGAAFHANESLVH